MRLFDLQPPTAALDALLDQERAMLLTGQLDGIARIAGDKERLLARLSSDVVVPERLAALRAKTNRNQELLLAAASGIEAALGRLATLRSDPPEMRTYQRDGLTAHIASSRKPDVNHRA